MVPGFTMGPSGTTERAPPLPHAPIPVLLHPRLPAYPVSSARAEPNGLYPTHGHLPEICRSRHHRVSDHFSLEPGSSHPPHSWQTKHCSCSPNSPTSPTLATKLPRPSLTFLPALLQPTGPLQPPPLPPAGHISPQSIAYPSYISQTSTS